ncbi:hypothetical protein TNCV_3898281 [Trichonephila clavipes]|nr:hypothetical protein TNCV_3898281 [Trichonephila clavipes]
MTRTTRSRWSHRCSIRFKSGEFAGQGRTGNSSWCSSNHERTLAAVWHPRIVLLEDAIILRQKQCACRGGHGPQRTDAYLVLIHRAFLNDQ